MNKIFEFGKVKDHNCLNCGLSVSASENDQDGAQCHLNPPIPVVVMVRNAIGETVPMIQPVYPPVFKADWCMQWRKLPEGWN